VLEAIDIAPRRANETQEIRAVDILEETPAPVEVPIAVEAPRVEHASIAPMAYDVPSMPAHLHAERVQRWNHEVRRAEPTFHIEPARSPKRLHVFVLAAMGASLLILGGAALRALLHASVVEEGLLPVTAASLRLPEAPLPPPEPAKARTTTTSAAVPADVTAPTTGTVLLARGVKRVSVDGTKITASAIVPCGQHTIAVGRRSRNADVPCGGMYLVTP
jgi:hypothetical protein